jgi:hypothetical protein
MRPRPHRPLAASAATGLLLAALGFGCAGGFEGPSLPIDEADRQQLRAELEASIERDRAELANLVAVPRDVDVDPLYDDATLRALADRITRDSARLAELREEPLP